MKVHKVSDAVCRQRGEKEIYKWNFGQVGVDDEGNRGSSKAMNSTCPTSTVIEMWSVLGPERPANCLFYNYTNCEEASGADL
jgi:hypothetical protein